MKAHSVALPKTYHHLASGGTRCRAVRPIIPGSPVRSSTQFQTCLTICFTLFFYHGNGRSLNLHVAIFHAHRITAQGQWWWSRGDGAVLVIHAAVAGTHEQIGFGEPAHWTPQMRAIDGKSDK